MIIFPAIDLRQGQVVRLKQGQPGQMTIFGAAPLPTARRWVDQGAKWLHIVNLDGALGNSGKKIDSASSINLQVLRSICTELPTTCIQFGGGVRSMRDLQHIFDYGVSRAILGTAAVSNPELIRAAVERFGAERLAVGLDSSKGTVVTHGWTQASALSPVQLGNSMRELGVRYALFTNVQRDGMMSGVDREGTAQLARSTGLQVIASGGVSSLGDLRRLISQQEPGIEGVIIGQALYTGSVDLGSAIQMANAPVQSDGGGTE